MNRIEIELAQQSMRLFEGQSLCQTYAISSGANGAGETINSECTPRGQHIIRAKIGAGAKANAVFVARRQTGEFYTPEMRRKYPSRDWILTRILWLSGCEVGKNRLGQNDTQRRYIYIHGTPDDVVMGKPGSRGCIRMRNQDIMVLFDWAKIGTPVNIIENTRLK